MEPLRCFIQHSKPWFQRYRITPRHVSWSGNRTANHQGVERKSTISYSANFLKNIPSTSINYFSSDLVKRLQGLGILKTYRGRGCRSGRAVKKRMNDAKLNIHTHIHRSVTSSTSSLNTTKPRTYCDSFNLTYCNTDEVTENINQPKTARLRLCLLNAQSLRNKSADFVDYILEENVDLATITESWLKENDAVVRRECVPEGYKMSDYSRTGRGGGGIALVCRENIATKMVRAEEKTSFEFAEWEVACNSLAFLLITVYRPPYSTNHPITTSRFFSEFAEYLETTVLCRQPLLISGDFNIHMDNPNDSDCKSFKEILNTMGLEQFVRIPTHISGHTLDLLITRKTDSLLFDRPVSSRYLSDHCAVICELQTPKPPLSVKKITYRKLKSINIDSFKKDILSSDLLLDTPTQLNELINCYNDTLSSLLNIHAPLIKKVVTVRPRVPWFNDEIKKSKQQRRKAERRWRRSKLENHKMAFNAIKNSTTYLMNKAKQTFFYNFVHEHSHDQRKLFAATKKLLNYKNEVLLPPHKDKSVLANNMGNFFVQKITDIRSNLDNGADCEMNFQTMSDDSTAVTSFTNFKTLNNDDTRKLIIKSTKSCELDPIPINLLKQCLEELLPIITAMINHSLQSGHFPTQWKEAVVKPLLKKEGLEPIYNNYRPVSNLSLLSKLTEKAVAEQISSYMLSNGLYPPAQSAYRQNHSTETALLKLKNDILLNMNNQQITLLVLLDLSSAFDTIDHSILLQRLSSDLGISGKAQDFCTSYLDHRLQRVLIDDVYSDKFELKYGVPQGSCLGPLLFTVYISKIFKLIEPHLPDVHCYADDTQLFLAFKPGSTSEVHAISAMESCIRDLKNWMHVNKLKLNEKKTEFLIIGTRQQLAKVHIDRLSIDDTEIKPSTQVRDLGAWFDSRMSMECHVAKICSSSFFHLYNIRKIRKYLSKETTQTLVHAFITSRIDYCNSLLYGMPSSLLTKLQRVQNGAARLVSGGSRYCHITPLLIDLHWLPIAFRIQFKILVITFKALNGTAPVYLQDLIHLKTNNTYSLRSTDQRLLERPRLKSYATLGDRSFSVGAPVLWNSLPIELRRLSNIDTFKNALKTHLFKIAFK